MPPETYDSQTDDDSFDSQFNDFDNAPDDKVLGQSEAVEDLDALIQEASAGRELAEAIEGGEESKPAAKEAAASEKAPAADDFEARAIDAGLTKEEIAELGEKGARRFVALTEKKIADIGRDALRRSQGPNAPTPAAPTPAEKKPADGDEFKPDWGDEKENLSPALLKNFEALQKHTEKRIAAIKEEFGRKASVDADRAGAEEEARIDKWFETKADMADLFGKGAGRAISGTKEMQARVEVFKEAEAIRIGREATGKPALSTEQLLERALQQLHSDRIGKAIEKKATEKAVENLKSQKDSLVSRPSKRSSDDGLSIKERARRNQIALARSKGIDV